MGALGLVVGLGCCTKVGYNKMGDVLVDQMWKEVDAEQALH